MHSIERYGIVALIFLVVTVVAVLMWDGGKDKKKKSEVLAGPAGAAAEPSKKPDASEAAARRLELRADSQPGPLVRRPRAEQPPAAATDEAAAAPPRALTDAPAPGGSDALPAPAAGESLTPPEQPAVDPVVGQTPPRSQPATRAYTVRAGDTLSEIAQAELGSAKRWTEILAVNPGLDPARMRSGKEIRLPGAAPSSTSASSKRQGEPERARASADTATNKAANPAPAAGARTHRVGQGENLWKIAATRLGDGKRWKEIADLNPAVDPDKLGLGQVLKLPAGAKQASSSGAEKASPKRAAKPAGDPTLVASNAGAERSPRRGSKVK